MYFDSHAHYNDERFNNERDALLCSMKDLGVSKILNAGADMSSSAESIALAEKYSFIYASVGVHPQDAMNMTDTDIETLRSYLKHNKVCALGEIGLDYHYESPTRNIQKECFSKQMMLANEENVPVIIHDREAHADCMDIINSFNNVIGVLHCYSGSLEMAKQLLDKGYYLSFTGIITFKNARKSHEIIKYMPLDRLMIETDCPYLAPEPFRGKTNHSGYIYRVAETISQICGISTEKVAQITYNNAMRFFNIESN